MRRLALILALVTLLVGGASGRGTAGTTGRMSGYITWIGSGKPISGIDVWACSPVDVAVTKTDAHGFFSFVSLFPGSYSVHFIAPTKETYEFTSVRVMADEITDRSTMVCPEGWLCDVLVEPPQIRTSSSVGTLEDDVLVPVRVWSGDLGC